MRVFLDKCSQASQETKSVCDTETQSGLESETKPGFDTKSGLATSLLTHILGCGLTG
jgi:hypothetical protein